MLLCLGNHQGLQRAGKLAVDVPLMCETNNCLKATETLVCLSQGDIWPWWETLWVVTTEGKRY